LSEEVFHDLFKHSAVKRTKFSGLKRNISFLYRQNEPTLRTHEKTTLFIFLIPLLFLFSCSPKEVKMERFFDGNNVGIYVDAVQRIPSGALASNLKGKSLPTPREQVGIFEFHNSGLSKENVKISESGFMNMT
jgi:hypothetical protein